ncbi:semialdehyde dehydrogenase [Paenibacillus antri]|uniref:Semialdehyde dehydrogenase n=1 Tax=Paenibacillus antri TaxID=2582848 RepID=A0A5R9GC07_9BACL|nr:phosphogluconate dehydrogenase C-terminal domain-containing protein [Paenibacillus antri]TLS50928.1 semialdehyde dehydrogenase [Paenibacillus antri]
MTNIMLIGAGGKMGCRIADNLKDTHDVLYVENGEQGIRNLADRGLTPTPWEEAAPVADVAVLAVSDAAIGGVAGSLVPQLRTGATVVLLDPAAAYLGQLPKREDISYFVCHPCHPPVFNDETDPAAKRDYFGGVKAKQAIVCALLQGPEERYEQGEALAKAMFAPVMRSHRITLEQMAMLEPTMAETIGSMMVTVLGEAMEEAIRRGVPYEAAKDFMMGHINVQLAIVFEKVNPFSDACLVAIEYGKRHIIKDGWKDLYEPERLREQIDVMLHPEKLKESARS